MPDIINLSQEQDLPGCVNTPVLLHEVARCISEDIKKPVMMVMHILAELAHYAVDKDDPILNVIALRLGLFPMPQDKLKKALESEMEKVKEIQHQQSQKSQEVGNGPENTVA